MLAHRSRKRKKETGRNIINIFKLKLRVNSYIRLQIIHLKLIYLKLIFITYQLIIIVSQNTKKKIIIIINCFVPFKKKKIKINICV
jgi:hypothetical protein